MKFESNVEGVALAGGLGSRVNAVPTQAVRVGLRQKYTPKGGMLDTVSGAEGDGIDRRCAAGAARSNMGRGKLEDRAMTSWFLVAPVFA